MNTQDNNFKRYVLSLPIVILFLLALAGLVNYSVDPYGLFDSARVEGFNKFKPKAALRVRITKPYLVEKFSPDIIIAGNSRPEIGLDPQNRCWIDDDQSVFNLSLPGASVYMAARYIQHAIEGNEIKQVFWGLDFKDFLESEESISEDVQWPPEAEAFEERLRVNANGDENEQYVSRKIKDYLTLLFSLDALKDSVSTVLAQTQTHVPTVRRDGFNPAEDFLDIMRLEGQGLIFKQKNIDVVDIFFKHKRTLAEDIHQSLHFESIRQLLEHASQKRVELILFINPYHSDYLYTIYSAGLWDKFLLWKKQLVELSAEYNVKLYDFSGFNVFSNPQPPRISNRKDILQWFWEPTHYRREYGDLLISSMLNRSCDSADSIDAGKRLTKGNITRHLAESNAQLQQFRSDYPATAERLKLIEP